MLRPPGSVDAEWEIFTANRDRIYRYVLGMVHDQAEAEDLTQETFLRAYRGQASLRDPDAARGWLYNIATHVCLDRLRQRGPHFSMDSGESSDLVESVASPAPSALEIAESQQTSACVQRCLDYLSDSYRAVILLHDGHSLTAPEIAKLLGVDVGAVKIRIHRARRKLQQLMEHGCAVSNNQSGLPVCAPKCGPPSPDPRETS
jgi:RNA polymerase sigma-70 factor (ECF subfamily)